MRPWRSLAAALAALPLAAALALLERAAPDLGPAVALLALPAAVLLAALAAPPREARDATGLLLGLGLAAGLAAALLLGPGLAAGALDQEALEWKSPPAQLALGVLGAGLLLGALHAPRGRAPAPEASGDPRGDRNLPNEAG